ncbi:hypothetical protein TEA_002162 [Camellia sinensis var. sinensis]|uniref:Uncharacterized protein n=1 Tax=Camellia sinensis var. sinensis TaxID=542762 RepID=A0A4S4D5P2_CAMSN|nr:hypothetical protein TEA_002162 [Camellia sinensis var. sinensis]
MAVKIMVRKSDGKAMYAEAMEDFVDLLLSFLTIPLANVVGCLDGDSSLGCVGNLFSSIKSLNNKWFATHRVPWSDSDQCSNHLQLDVGLVSKFKCSSQPFQLQERIPNFYYHDGELSTKVLWLTYRRPSVNNRWLSDITLIDPKSPKWERSFEEFVKRPGLFLVSDGLVVLPSAGITSSISYLKDLDVSIDDMEEHVIKINKQESDFDFEAPSPPPSILAISISLSPLPTAFEILNSLKLLFSTMNYGEAEALTGDIEEDSQIFGEVLRIKKIFVYCQDEKRALQAEEEMMRGRTKLRQGGKQIQGVIRSSYKIEKQAGGLKMSLENFLVEKHLDFNPK